MSDMKVNAGNAIADINNVLKVATAQNIDMAKKMVQVNVQEKLQGVESGKGNLFDGLR